MVLNGAIGHFAFRSHPVALNAMKLVYALGIDGKARLASSHRQIRPVATLDLAIDAALVTEYFPAQTTVMLSIPHRKGGATVATGINRRILLPLARSNDFSKLFCVRQLGVKRSVFCPRHETGHPAGQFVVGKKTF
jgi:hypothetical protein